jgi:hypothetical protein
MLLTANSKTAVVCKRFLVVKCKLQRDNHRQNLRYYPHLAWGTEKNSKSLIIGYSVEIRTGPLSNTSQKRCRFNLRAWGCGVEYKTTAYRWLFSQYISRSTWMPRMSKWVERKRATEFITPSHVKFEVLTAVTMKNTVVWHVKPCRP